MANVVAGRRRYNGKLQRKTSREVRIHYEEQGYSPVEPRGKLLLFVECFQSRENASCLV